MNKKLESESCIQCTNFHTSPEHYPCLMCVRNEHDSSHNVADFFEKSHVSDYIVHEYEWVDIECGYVKCSKCGWETNEMYFWDDKLDRYSLYSRYCPNCGAKMKEVT